MTIFFDERCRGSLGSPLEEAVSGEGDESTGVCPVCHRRLTLGYARRLPVHPPSPDEETVAAPTAR